MLLTALRRHGLCGRHLPRPHYPPRAGLKPDPSLYLGASDSACTDAHSSRLRPVAVSIQTAGVHVPQPAGPVRGRQEDLSQARLSAPFTVDRHRCAPSLPPKPELPAGRSNTTELEGDGSAARVRTLLMWTGGARARAVFWPASRSTIRSCGSRAGTSAQAIPAPSPNTPGRARSPLSPPGCGSKLATERANTFMCVHAHFRSLEGLMGWWMACF